MPAGKFFAYAAELMKVNPPHVTDQPIDCADEADRHRARQELRLRQGRSRRAARRLDGAPEDAQAADGGKVADARARREWLVDEHRYDGRLRKLLSETRHRRAARAWREPARRCDLSPQSRRRAGKPLDGANKYRSISTRPRCPRRRLLVDYALRSEGFQVANALNRFAVSSWMPFKFNPDGSLDLYFQNESPGRARKATGFQPREGRLTLTMRIYAPKSEVLTGKWRSRPPSRVRRQFSAWAVSRPFFRALRLRMRCSA